MYEIDKVMEKKHIYGFGIDKLHNKLAQAKDNLRNFWKNICPINNSICIE